MKFGVYSILILFVMILCLCDASKSPFNTLKRIPVKSIESPDGDTIDCINIYEQPAFDHPLLKNHTIQMSPSYYPKGVSAGNPNQITQLWQSRGNCPEGTIPIRRTNEEEYQKYGKKQPTQTILLNNPSQHEHSFAYVRGSKYYGATAILNVWQPKVENSGEFSLAQLWLIGGPAGNVVETIEAGWHVFPMLNSDNNTRLFVYWTNDGYQFKGCYNLRCPGFVQTSNQVTIGGTIAPVSAYHGNQYEYSFRIWKDAKANAWWLSAQNVIVGYWPNSLYTYLADSASLVEWGGEIYTTKPKGQHTATQMGSGHFAAEGFGGASYFKNLGVIDESGNVVPPVESQLRTITQAPGCYDISPFKDSQSGFGFYFGGPGRNPNCS